MYYVMGFNRDKSRAYIMDTNDNEIESYRVSDIPKLGVKIHGVDGDSVSVFDADGYINQRMAKDKLHGVESAYELITEHSNVRRASLVEIVDGALQSNSTCQVEDDATTFKIQLTDCVINSNIKTYPILEGTKKIFTFLSRSVVSISRSSHGFSNSKGSFGVVIPDSCEYTGEYAFKNTKVTDVTINGKSTVEEGCFKDCLSLTKLTLKQPTSIGKWAFSGCSQLEEIIGSENISFVEPAGFVGCFSLKTLDLSRVCILPDTDNIGIGAFETCTSLQEVIWNECSSLADRTFRRCENLRVIYNAGHLFNEDENYSNTSIFEYCGIREIVVRHESNVEVIKKVMGSMGFKVQCAGVIEGDSKKAGTRLLIRR